MSERGILTLNPMSLSKGQGYVIGTQINAIATES